MKASELSFLFHCFTPKKHHQHDKIEETIFYLSDMTNTLLVISDISYNRCFASTKMFRIADEYDVM